MFFHSGIKELSRLIQYYVPDIKIDHKAIEQFNSYSYLSVSLPFLILSWHLCTFILAYSVWAVCEFTCAVI